MTSERPEDELEPKADEQGLERVEDENAGLDADEGLDDEEDLDEAFDDELDDGAPRSSSGTRDLEPAPAKPMAQVRGRASRAATSSVRDASTSEDELPYVDDPVSKYWVLAIVGVFLLILAYGLLFGKSGALTPPTPSPTPSSSPTPTLSASPVPSGSLTPAPSITILPSGSAPVPSVSAVSPTAAPSPTPAPSS